MSMIETMSIMGIRSFGPNDSDQQVIKFQHPLTLLVGPNGAGKTTIIECLKYATTGEQPLNTKGGAFVHDPKLAHESEVRAKVRLQCQTIHGHKILVDRSMIAIQKKTTVQFKTLDGVITKVRDGEKSSITSKCADLNREMVSALGVSKAVLDNVIFCHQEESNWPLSEGKFVKQRFDDIFAATRYIQALEEIRKIQKNQKSEKNKEDIALEFLQKNSLRAKEIKKKLEAASVKLDAAKQSGKTVAEQLIPVEEQLREISKKRTEISRLDGELRALRSRKEQMISDRSKLESRINNMFHGTDKQLEGLLHEQGQLLSSKKQLQQQSEEQIEPLQEKIRKISDKKTELSVQQGKFQQQVKNAEKQRRVRTELVKQAIEDSNIQMTDEIDVDATNEQMVEFERRFKNFADSELKQIKSEKMKLDKELKETEDAYQSAWQTKAELVEGIKHKKNSLVDLKEKHAQSTRELKRLKAAADGAQVDALQAQVNAALQDLEKAQNTFNFDLLQRELKDMNSKKSQLQSDMDGLESEILEVQTSSQTRTRLEVLRKDKQSREENKVRLQSKLEEPLSHIGLEGHSSYPVMKEFDQWIEDKEATVRSSQREYDAVKSKLTKLKAELDMTSQQIEEKRARQSFLDESLFDVCGSQDLDHDLTVLEGDIKKLQGNKGLTDGIQHMYKRFINEMRNASQDANEEVCCPLCQRLFDQPADVDELIEDLEEKLIMVPRKLENQTKELEKKQARYKLLQENKPKKDEYDHLTQADIPRLESHCSKLSSEITQIKKQAASLESKCCQLKEEEDTAKKCLPDISQLTILNQELEQLCQEIRILEDKLPSNLSLRSMDELNEEKRRISSELKKVNKSLDEKRNEIERKKSTIHQLKEDVNNKQAEKLKLAADLQKCEQLQERQKTLSADIQRMKSEIESNDSKLIPVDRKVQELSQQKSHSTKRCEDKSNAMNRKKHELDVKMNEIDQANHAVRRFEESRVELKLQMTNSRLVELERDMETSSTGLHRLRDEIKKIQKDITTCIDRQRDLEDNFALRERNRDIDKVYDDVQMMEEQLGGMNAGKMDEEAKKLNREHSNLIDERVRAKEREAHLSEEAFSLKRELNQDDYKHADERYRDSLIKSTMLQLASDDLMKYYKALDRAVMRFHKIKMDEINKIIKDLWQETYRGNDIDYIEICSNEDTGESTRRVFNYRVVMHCSGTAMDMRGRCSAGQKVLASIVIRLALAETFCINCGILALDEPTTNLDRDNIESLAKALVSIIETRSRQRNFQMVVITHDEDFVDLLGRAQYVDHFFRIMKSDKAKSRILKCPIKDLES